MALIVINSDEATPWRLALIEKQQSLQSALATFVDQLRQEINYPAWAWDGVQFITGDAARARAIEVIGELFYTELGDGREADVCPGLLGCSAEAIQYAVALNNAKLEFQRALQQLVPYGIAVTTRDEDGRQRAGVESLAKIALAKIGFARLHRKYAYRKLIISPTRPDYVGMSWAHTKKVERISKEMARRRLGALIDGPNVQRDVEHLNDLPDHEVLAVVRQYHAHVRANLVWHGQGVGGKDKVRQRGARLPILIPCAPGEPLPPYGAMKNNPNVPERTRTRGRKIEQEVFLPCILAHRYLPEFRQA